MTVRPAFGIKRIASAMATAPRRIGLARFGTARSPHSERVGCSINTVDKLLRDAGEVALAYHDDHVFRPLTFDDAMENTVVQYLRLARRLQDSRQQRSRPCRSTG